MPGFYSQPKKKPVPVAAPASAAPTARPSILSSLKPTNPAPIHSMPIPKPAQLAPPPVPPKTPAERAAEAAKTAKTARGVDIREGEALADKYFNTPQNADIMSRYKAMANGLTDPEYNTLHGRANNEINQSMQTGLRALTGQQAASGLRGGAAGAQALSFLGNINNQRTKLASDLAAQDIALKRQGLNDYSSYYTGDRAGRVGTVFGNAGLGAADRASANQLVLGQDFLANANRGLGDAQSQRVPGAFDFLGQGFLGDLGQAVNKPIQTGAGALSRAGVPLEDIPYVSTFWEGWG